jgi:hypothetical protein
MRDLFETTGLILLQPGSLTIPYSFTFPAASSGTANDGAIPFESTISSAAIKVFDATGTDRTTEMVVSSSVASPSVTVSLKYPATTGYGRYSIEFVLTLNTGAKMEFDFTRVLAVD